VDASQGCRKAEIASFDTSLPDEETRHQSTEAPTLRAQFSAPQQITIQRLIVVFKRFGDGLQDSVVSRPLLPLNPAIRL
jgi:hypothetical protein